MIRLHLSGETEVTKIGLQKRVAAKRAAAVKSAPDLVKAKWDDILALKGNRGSDIQKQKREFVMQWVSDPTWTSAYFHQKLNLEESKTQRLTGVWITEGRLQSMIGEKETKLALKEEWWQVWSDPNSSKVMVYYTEQMDIGEQGKTLSKEIRGGTELAIADAQEMMCDGIEQSFSQGIKMGIEDAPEVQTEPPKPKALGVGPLAIENSNSSGVLRRPASAVGNSKGPVMKRPATAAGLAQEKEENKLAKQEEKKHAKDVAAKVTQRIHTSIKSANGLCQAQAL